VQEVEEVEVQMKFMLVVTASQPMLTNLKTQTSVTCALLSLSQIVSGPSHDCSKRSELDNPNSICEEVQVMTACAAALKVGVQGAPQ
jgi:hypothetical protein